MSSFPLSFPSVVHQDRGNVPVLYELLKGDEEQCRVWLRAEMNRIPDPLIDSLFAGLIMSSSSSVVAKSRLNVSELRELLEGTKMETKMVLKNEMDRLTESLFEMLTNKLMMNTNLDRSQNGGDSAQVVHLFDQVEPPNGQSRQPAFLISQPSTSTFGHDSQHSNGDELELNTVEIIEIKEEVEDGEETRVIDIARLNEDYQVKREIKEENDMAVQNVQDSATEANQQIQDWVKLEIKEEEEDGQMVDIKIEEEEEEVEDNQINVTNEVNEDNQSGGGESRNGQNATIEPTQQMDCVELEIKGEFDYGHEIVIKQEEEDEDQTNKGEMAKIKEEDAETEDNAIEGLAEDYQSDDESRSIEMAPMNQSPTHPTGQHHTNIRQSRIMKRNQTHEEQPNEENNGHSEHDNDDDGEETSPPEKKPRMDSIQAHSLLIGQCSRPQTGETQLNQVDNQNAGENTSGLSSNGQATQANPEGTQDKQIITVSVQCPQSGCSQMFAEHELNRHLLDVHFIGPHRCLVKDCKQSYNNNYRLGEHLKQAHDRTTECAKCAKHFGTYHSLSVHNTQYHQLGQFQCSFPACAFTDEFKLKVYQHYTQQHKAPLTCHYADCNYRTSNPAHLKEHLRTHSGTKPYRCKWPECDYTAIRKSDMIKHIRVHFARNPSSAPNGAQLDPKNYLEVVHHLL